VLSRHVPPTSCARSRLAQADAQPEPGEAAADDRDAGVFRQFLHY